MNTTITTAIVTATNQQVEIVAVNGGWTTVHTMGPDTREFKVRNGALSRHVTLSGRTAELAMQKAQAAKAEPVARAAKEPRKTLDPSERKNGVVYAGYLPQYTAYTTELADGSKKRSIDKGDSVALALRRLELVDVYKTVSSATGTAIVELRERFAHLNPGMQRMNLGNMLRRATR